MVDYDRIFSRIDKIGVSKAFVCDELGKSRSWLHAAKRKRSKLSNQIVERLAHILLTTPEYLRCETDDLGIKSAPTMKAAAMERIHNVGKASKDKNAASDGENE